MVLWQNVALIIYRANIIVQNTKLKYLPVLLEVYLTDEI